MMERNLDRRVEAIVPIAAPEMQDRLQEILDLDLADDTRAWELDPDGTWHKVPAAAGINAQQALAGAGHRPVPPAAGTRGAARRTGIADRTGERPLDAAGPAGAAAAARAGPRDGAGRRRRGVAAGSAMGSWRWSSFTGPATTTGACRRAKSTPARPTSRPPSARSERRRASMPASGRSCPPRPTWTGVASKSGSATGP